MEHAAEQGGVDQLPDALPLAGDERGQDALHQDGRAHLVGDAGDRLHGLRKVAFAHREHQAAARLRGLVEAATLRPRPLRAVGAGDRVDQVRLLGGERRVVGLQVVRDAARVVREEDVAALDELVEDPAARGLLEVQRHAALVAVDRLEAGVAAALHRHGGAVHGAHAAVGVALNGVLDLDHVGAKIT